jgi:hypothetical protein
MSNTIKKTGICEFCGKEFTQIMKKDAHIREHCFDCYFWFKKVNLAQHHLARRVIVKGEHYMVGSNDPTPFNGFGGRDFSIKFYDGRKIKSSNLWHQGEIPGRFKKLLPDNAEFIYPKSNNFEDNPYNIPF